MTRPTAEGFAKLDKIIKALVQASDGQTLDEFRVSISGEFREKKEQIRTLLFWLGCGFLIAVFVALIFPPLYPQTRVVGVVLWAASLGGIGAVSGLFVHVAGIAAQEAMRIEDRFSVLVRVFLGVAFSVVLTTIMVTGDLIKFFEYLSNMASADTAVRAAALAAGREVRTTLLLLPFLCGFSIPFVLGLLDKAMQAVQMTIGMELRGPARGRRRR
jgi:hypothetical protein